MRFFGTDGFVTGDFSRRRPRAVDDETAAASPALIIAPIFPPGTAGGGVSWAAVGGELTGLGECGNNDLSGDGAGEAAGETVTTSWPLWKARFWWDFRVSSR